MPLIPFPNVPKLPGVPALMRAVSIVSGALSLLSAIGLPFNFLAPAWGIFNAKSAAVFVFDTVLSFGIRNSTRVSDFPMEQGAFNSYNKTGSPFEIQMRIALGGSQYDRASLLKTLEKEVKSINLYNIVTPDGVYRSATLEGYDYRRETTNGASMLIVDLSLREVRVTAGVLYSGKGTAPLPAATVQAPSAASPALSGQVQPALPTPSQTTASQNIA